MRAGSWRGLCASGVLVLMAVSALPCAGQRPPLLDSRLFTPMQSSAPAVHPGIALASSTLIPGAGQYLLKADRWVPFLAVEVWAWLAYLNRRSDARSLATEYRDLAWFAGRRNSVGARRDSTFEYYEAMSQYHASGLYDLDDRLAGVQPELDVTTYNGEQWRLAKSIYFPGGVEFPPGTQPYARALAFYEQRAIPAAFAWAWGASNLELQTFRELIRRSDEAYRDATQRLGLILANHVVSAIDALVLARMRAGNSRLNLRLESHAFPGRHDAAFTAAIRFFW